MYVCMYVCMYVWQYATCAGPLVLEHRARSTVSRSLPPQTELDDSVWQCLFQTVATVAVAHPSNKLLGVRTLMVESTLGLTPMGCSFNKLDTSKQTVRNSGRHTLVTH